MTEILLVIGVLGLAGATAYVLAARLFAGSLVDTLAASLLLFMILLIGAANLLGVLGLLRLPLMLAVLALVCGMVFILRHDLPTLIPPSEALRFAPTRLEVLFGIGLLALILIVIVPPWFSQLFDANLSLADNDVVLFEIPNMMHYVQDGTLWSFSGQLSFYPSNYHMLLAWMAILDKSFTLFPYIQLLIVIMAVLYVALLGMWALPTLSPVQRLLSGLLIVTLILAQPFSHQVILTVGKSDLFTNACMIMLIYYLMRYWTDPPPRKNPYLVFVGMAGGLMVSSKLTSIYWGPVFALVHLLLVIYAEKHPRRILGTLLHHTLLIGLPGVLLIVVWLARLSYFPNLYESLSPFLEIINNSRIINNLDAPQIVQTAPAWMPFALALVIGGLLMILPGKRRWLMGLRIVGIVIVSLSFLRWTVFDRAYAHTIASFVMCLLVALMVCLGRLTVPHLVSARTAALSVWTGISCVILAFTPQSVWQGIVAYRYNIVSYLGALVLVALLAEFVWRRLPSQALTFMDDQCLRLHHRMLGGGAVALLIVGAVFRNATYHTPETYTYWDNAFNTHPTPTSLFAWVRANLHNTTIVTALVPSVGLYGDHLDNRVYTRPADFFPPLKDFWFFSPQEIITYIERHKITHVILPLNGFWTGTQEGYIEHLQPRIQALRAKYPVIYEDEQAIVFATNFSMPLPRLTDLRFEFDHLAAPGVYTRGFQRPGKDESFRWVVTQPAQVCANVTTDHDFRLDFKALASASPDSLDPLVVMLNGSPLELTRENQADGVRFESLIERKLLAASPPLGTCFSFDGLPLSDSYQNVYALDWLSLTPIQVDDFWRYEFTADLPSDATLSGWGEAETLNNNISYRWMEESEAVIVIDKSSHQPLRLEFSLNGALDPTLIDTLTLEANNVQIPLERRADAHAPNGAYFVALLPACEPESCPDRLTLRFKTDRLPTPQELGISNDTRRLGLMFDWLRISTLPSL